MKTTLEFGRLQEILNILSENRSCTVSSLAQRLYVSEATIRRDLNALEKQGHVRRVFGGVVLIQNDQKDVPFYGHTTLDEDKEEIARRAAELIHNGDTIMLDASSTACALIRHLKRFKSLTVITNSALVAGGLQELDARVFITGGFMPHNSQGFVGNYAESMLANFSADILFFTCAALDMNGEMSDTSSDEISIRRVMMRRAKKRVLLCDKQKFGLNHCFTLGTLEDVDVLISDAEYPGLWHEKQLK